MKLTFFIVMFVFVLSSCKTEDTINVFNENWAPSPASGSFKQDDFITWGGSVVKGDDGKYYMFASRWPKKLSMSAWVTNSEVVLAVSETPDGPYEFEKVILPTRGKQYWDGMATHNPTIRYHKGKYILFYTGVNYDFEQPLDSIPTRDMYEKAWNNKRIGVAVADDPTGLWKRMDEPVLQPRPGKWDGAITSNPAPVVHDDGSVLLMYKSAPVPYPERNKNRKMEFGIVRSDHYLGEYKREQVDNHITLNPVSTDVEDPYVWYDGKKYHMLAKCMNEA
ncbi:MAG: glycoside hydrolase family protein, partial [Draconibacterium sp.]|nr:glycoside hydrolase family protein [Draconibacterium sp.]